MSSLGELDRSKVVDLDLGSNEFKQNARNILAEWAKQPPFYVFSFGPPQVVCGRHADVHEVFSDTERFSSELPRGHGFEQFDKFMGVQFITQMDGERHARIRRLLMPAFSALGHQDHQEYPALCAARPSQSPSSARDNKSRAPAHRALLRRWRALP
jgi:cytochrome P450